MGRGAVDQTFKAVGTSSVQVLGPRAKRRGIIVSVSPGNPGVGDPQTVLAAAFNTANAGVAASYTVPANSSATLTSASFRLIAGTAPTVALQVVRGATTVGVWTGSASQLVTNVVPLQAGDVVQWNVTAGGVGSTADFTLGITLDPRVGRITLSYLRPAVLDAGINIYPGTAPLVLNDESVGASFQEGLFAIASQAGNQLVIWDIGEG